MESDYQKIIELTNQIEAQIILQMLLENGIDAIAMNKRDSSYQVFGVIEIYCQTKDVVTALHLLNNNKKYEE